LSWATLVVLGAGALVASLVLGSPVLYGRWRYRLRRASREEDLPWDELLVLIEQRHHERDAAGLPLQEATEQELDGILVRLPMVTTPRPVELPEDHAFEVTGGSERRAGRRRWGNPTEVYLRELLVAESATGSESLLDGLSPFASKPMHGLVVNRSTGGLGIYTDKEIPAGTFITIRAVNAPPYVRAALAEVRHCLRGARGFILGCEFTQEIPWNVRVWFG
jgi:hypothetical protein